MGRCYFDGEPCNCNAFDVAGDCPRDDYVHDDQDLYTEEEIEEIYNEMRSNHED